MSDDLTQLDKSGTNCQWVRAYLGPTVGWVMLPVVPERIVTTAGALAITDFDSRVLMNAIITTVTLPDVNTWMQAPYQAVQSAFDRSLWIKDYGGNVNSTTQIVTVTPYGSQTIDGLSSWQIIEPYALLRLYPLTNLAGWYTG